MLEVISLGTGSAVPTAARNLSATAVVRDGETFLFDCGEGTQMQYRRAGLRPSRLTHIFISHFHGDHVFGLPGLLTSLQMAECDQKIQIFAPKGIKSYISFHKRFARFNLSYPLEIHEVPDDSKGETWQQGGLQITCLPLKHRVRCLGWSIREADRPGRFNVEEATRLGVPSGPLCGRLQQGESITTPSGETVEPAQVLGPARRGHHFAYCLDTAPCANAIKLARDVDVLVHDATFSNANLALAKISGHSTAAQAADIAKKAGARRLLLTHLSARLNPNEEGDYLDEALAVFKNSMLARDLGRLKVEYEEPA